MSENDLLLQEYKNTGTTKTNNEKFERDGYLVVKNLWDRNQLFHPLPAERGQFNYWGRRLDQFTKSSDVERQVEGSLSRYTHPQYYKIHNGIRFKLEEILGKKLYNTYYYDRFYFPGQELTKHADRDACEISITVHVSSNINEEWPIWVKTPDVFDETKKKLISKGENRSVILNEGDGMLYKGCERPHWRDPMPGLIDMSLQQLNGENINQLYYHQIFFHYVLQDGSRAHCAWDMSR